MNILPAFIRNLLTRRQPPQPKRCTDEAISELMGRTITHDNSRDQPETVDQTRVRDMLDRARREDMA
jgi:hypothetical protein